MTSGGQSSGRVVVVDCETTGLSGDDRIVSLAIVPLDDNLEPREDVFYAEFSPGRPSHPKAFEKHRLTDAHLAGCPAFADLAPQIHALLCRADLVVGHNVEFDARFIDAELERCGLSPPPVLLYCTMRAAEGRWPRGRRSLDAVAARIKVSRRADRHDAREDALIAGAIYRVLRLRAARTAAKRDAAPGTRIRTKDLVPTLGAAHFRWPAREAQRRYSAPLPNVAASGGGTPAALPPAARQVDHRLVVVFAALTAALVALFALGG